MSRRLLISSVSGAVLGLFAATSAQAFAPVIWIFFMGAGKTAGVAAGAVAGKAALTTAALKTATAGSFFSIKGLTFTKTSTALVTVSGVALAAEASASTIGVLQSIDYKIPDHNAARIKDEIGSKAVKKQAYKVRYCLDDGGKKIVIPSYYQNCPLGGKPKRGESFEFKGG